MDAEAFWVTFKDALKLSRRKVINNYDKRGPLCQPYIEE